jgi:hypothetical protein
MLIVMRAKSLLRTKRARNAATSLVRSEGDFPVLTFDTTATNPDRLGAT